MLQTGGVETWMPKSWSGSTMPSCRTMQQINMSHVIFLAEKGLMTNRA